jgi:catechol 2,3-dioxygenase-like lactoylglutathione lyase family enzyme
MKLEVVVIPVSDVDRAAEFFRRLGWRVDADFRQGDSRLLQFTPPGSPCSIVFGTGITSAAPGTAKLELVVSDIEAARDELRSKGVDASEVFHDARGGYSPFDPNARASGPIHNDAATRRTRSSATRMATAGWCGGHHTVPGRIDSGDDVRLRTDLASAGGARQPLMVSTRSASAGRAKKARLVRRVHGGRAGREGTTVVSESSAGEAAAGSRVGRGKGLH